MVEAFHVRGCRFALGWLAVDPLAFAEHLLDQLGESRVVGPQFLAGVDVVVLEVVLPVRTVPGTKNFGSSQFWNRFVLIRNRIGPILFSAEPEVGAAFRLHQFIFSGGGYQQE